MIGPGDAFAEEGAAIVRRRAPTPPRVAVVLGSGLGGAVRALEVEAELSFSELPGFPMPTALGHAGRLAVGRLNGVPTLAFLGRVHLYEGHAMPLVTLPTRLAAALGVRFLVVTASVGGLDPSLGAETIVVGEDHINFLGEDALRGWRDGDGRPAFVDLRRAYDPELAELALAAVRDEGLPPTRGVYAAMPGPSYETPAEVEFLRRAGATVVGMSVVPEVTAAAALGLRCLGLFCVTNTVGAVVRHEDVTAAAGRMAAALGRVLARVLPGIRDGRRDGR